MSGKSLKTTYEYPLIHLCEGCGGEFEMGDRVVSLSDGYIDENEDYDIENIRLFHRDCYLNWRERDADTDQ